MVRSICLFLMMISVSSLYAFFEFKDLAGFKTCLDQKVIVLEKDQAKSLLTKNDILIKCHERSLELVKNEKNKAVIKEYIEVIKTQFKKEEALPHLAYLVKLDAKECNPMPHYEVIMLGLSHPEHYPTKDYSYVAMAKEVVGVCLKDSEFKTDFMEEKETTDTYKKTNVCQILVAQKLAPKCP